MTRGAPLIALAAGAVVAAVLFALNLPAPRQDASPVVIVQSGTVLRVPAGINNSAQPGGVAACMAHDDCNVAGVLRIDFTTLWSARISGTMDSGLPFQVAFASGSGNINIAYYLSEPYSNGTTAAGPGYLFWSAAASNHVNLSTYAFNDYGPIAALPAGSGTFYLINWSTVAAAVVVGSAILATVD